jgi:hypothetical protein
MACLRAKVEQIREMHDSSLSVGDYFMQLWPTVTNGEDVPFRSFSMNNGKLAYWCGHSSDFLSRKASGLESMKTSSDSACCESSPSEI